MYMNTLQQLAVGEGLRYFIKALMLAAEVGPIPHTTLEALQTLIWDVTAEEGENNSAAGWERMAELTRLIDNLKEIQTEKKALQDSTPPAPKGRAGLHN